jgi:predicted CXXCH cytochrome family protein
MLPASRAQLVSILVRRLISLWLPWILLTTLSVPAISQATPVREADAVCARCHAETVRTYLTTPMANASGPSTERLKPDTFVHKASGAVYSVGLVQGQAALTIRRPKTSSTPEVRSLTYFLGSGHLGITYLYFVNDYLFESPVAWYAASGKYDMKPGFGEVPHPPPAIPMQSNCLRCHMSAVQPSDPGTINRYQRPPFLHTGITCESCHGDSSEHVRSDGKKSIVDPARLDAEKRDSICISCHLEGDVTVERAGHSPLDYRPGESISTYLSFYVRGSASLTARGVSEVEQLGQSVCKRTSGERMSCTSCHDPHFTPGPEQRTAFYRAKCLACHAQPSFASAHHPENQDCTSCHMRRSGAENIPHVAWTDHRILRVPEPVEIQPPSHPEESIHPIFSPAATSRDLAMADYKLLLDGDRQLEGRTFQQLVDLKPAINGDAEALDALGNLAAQRGDFHEAEQDFRRVLQLAPDDLTALSNLGIVLAKQGRTSDAIPLLRSAFDRNQDLPGLAMNLARVQCMTGDGASARKTLESALVFSPGLEDIERLLDQMTSCGLSGSRP